MTAQFTDTILIAEKRFSIVGVNGNGLFTPESIGVVPVPTISACWRGYVCHYKIADDKLILDELQLSLGSDEGTGRERKFIPKMGPEINGVKPGTSGLFNNTYKELDLEIRFTGGLLAGNGFLQELYVHMGFHPAWKYQTVFELVFEAGNVREIRDASRELEQIRNKMSAAPLQPDILKSSREEVEAWIEKTFRLDYDLNQ